jgi:signal transduction histidine kinase
MDGATSLEELSHKVDTELLQNPKRLKEFVEHSLSMVNGVRKFDYEEYLPNLKGEWRHEYVQVSVAPGYEESLGRVYFSFIDITERKQAEERLKLYQERLEEIVNERTLQLRKEIEWHNKAETELRQRYETECHLREVIEQESKSRAEFMRALVHELKTPLTPLIASSDYLAHLAGDSNLSPYAKNISVGAMNLSARIDELLDLARGEMGMLRLKIEAFDLVELIREVIDYVQPEAEHNHQTLLSLVDVRTCKIQADEDRIRQVLLNLLDNAMKFTRKDGKIILSLLPRDTDVLIEVRDSGIGLTPECLKTLFEPYRRLEQDKEKVGGLGLGLALCKLFVNLHGGKIWANNNIEEEGSTFSFTIPLSIIAAK